MEGRDSEFEEDDDALRFLVDVAEVDKFNGLVEDEGVVEEVALISVIGLSDDI